MTKEELQHKIDALSRKLMILQLRAHVLQDLLQKAQVEYLKYVEEDVKGDFEHGENA